MLRRREKERKTQGDKTTLKQILTSVESIGNMPQKVLSTNPQPSGKPHKIPDNSVVEDEADDVIVKFAAAGLKIWNGVLRLRDKIAQSTLSLVEKVPEDFVNSDQDAFVPPVVYRDNTTSTQSLVTTPKEVTQPTRESSGANKPHTSNINELKVKDDAEKNETENESSDEENTDTTKAQTTNHDDDKE